MKFPHLLACAGLLLPLLADELPPGLAMQTAAKAFLASLDDAKRARAALPFDGEERENWHYTPRDRAGLSMKDMNDAQKNAAVALVTSALSEEAALKAAQIISLEALLGEIEKRPEFRDAEKYYLSIFGTPGDEKGWGWRLEGHHLSVNFTLVGDHGISVTPSFFGANPAKVREGPKQGMRPLAAEEDLARALAKSLIAAGKSSVVFDQKAPKEILTGEERKATQLEPVGIPAADLDETNKKALRELIEVYTGRHRPDLAASDMKKINEAGFDKIRFGWAGGLEPGDAYYYRIQGPGFLMEAANTQNKANHIHTVWREFDGDFGRDLLGEHHKTDGH